LEFSSEVQRAMLPQQAPSVSGLEIGAFSRPAQIIGGDYFDFIDFKNGGHGLVVADVMGHGVSASLIMSGLQAALRTLIPEADSPRDVMDKVNKYYLHNINLTTFITTFLARFDAGNRALTYCNAGHNPPLLLTPSNGSGYTTSWIKPTAAAIGIMENYSSGMESIVLKRGNGMVIYTDGLTEAVNAQDEPFGSARLEQTARAHAAKPAQDIISAIRADLNIFTGGGPLADDVTAVVCKILD
jgi:sigma-B regulation protein RsbU (phosphoserine phosphatase)